MGGDPVWTDGRFAAVPEWVLLHPDLSDGAVRLYAVLQRFANSEGGCWPSRATLGTRLGVGVNAVDRRMAELVAVGAVVKRQRHREDGGLSSCMYLLRFAPTPTPANGGTPTPANGGTPTPANGVAERKPLGTKAIRNESAPRAANATRLLPEDLNLDAVRAIWPGYADDPTLRREWGRARKRWGSALTFIHGEPGSHSGLLAWVDRFRDAPDRDFCKSLHVWLRDDGWTCSPPGRRDKDRRRPPEPPNPERDVNPYDEHGHPRPHAEMEVERERLRPAWEAWRREVSG